MIEMSVTTYNTRAELAGHVDYVRACPEVPTVDQLLEPWVDAVDSLAVLVEQVESLAAIAELYEFAPAELVERAERAYAVLCAVVEQVSEVFGMAIAGDGGIERANVGWALSQIVQLDKLRHGVRYAQAERAMSRFERSWLAPAELAGHGVVDQL